MYKSVLRYENSMPYTCFGHFYGLPQGCALEKMDISR